MSIFCCLRVHGFRAYHSVLDKEKANTISLSSNQLLYFLAHGYNHEIFSLPHYIYSS